MQIGNFIINRSSKLKQKLTKAVESLEKGVTVTESEERTFWTVIGIYESRVLGICISRVTYQMDGLTDRYVAAKEKINHNSK